MAHPIRALFPPAHPRPLEALADDRLARRLYRAAADLPAPGPVARVVHAVGLILEVDHRLTTHLAPDGRHPQSSPRNSPSTASPPSCFSRCDRSACHASAAS